MFDFENPYEEETVEPVKENTVDAEWDRITDAHAEREEKSGRADARQNTEDATNRIYKKISKRRRERTCIASVRYALLAIGLTAVAYLVRDMTWLAIALGVVGLGFGLTAAYGAGKCHEM